MFCTRRRYSELEARNREEEKVHRSRVLYLITYRKTLFPNTVRPSGWGSQLNVGIWGT